MLKRHFLCPGPRRNYCGSTTQLLKIFSLGVPYHFIFLNFVVFRNVPRGYGESRSLRIKVGNCVRYRCIAHSSTRVFLPENGGFKSIILVYRYSPKDFLNYVQIWYLCENEFSHCCTVRLHSWALEKLFFSRCRSNFYIAKFVT